LLDAAAAQTDLEGWLEARLRAGERLMGFGHRVFHGNDPRAEAMRQALQRMGPLAGAAGFRCAAGAGGGDSDRAGEARAQIAAKCRDQGGFTAGRGRYPAASVYPGLRGGTLRGIAGACAGAAEDGADDPAGIGLHRASDERMMWGNFHRL
jgi:hypothetical protein